MAIITEMTSTSKVGDDRATINTNFANVNNELSSLTTMIGALSTTVSSHTTQINSITATAAFKNAVNTFTAEQIISATLTATEYKGTWAGASFTAAQVPTLGALNGLLTTAQGGTGVNTLTGITILGTIATGTWQGSTIAATYLPTIGALTGILTTAQGGTGANTLTGITILGTITTGTWQGATIAAAYLTPAAASAWTAITTPSITGAHTFITADSIPTGYPLRFNMSSSTYYAQIVTHSGTGYSTRGVAMTTTGVTNLSWADRRMVETVAFGIPGAFADAVDTAIILSDLQFRWINTSSKMSFVGLDSLQGTADTGNTQSSICPMIAGASATALLLLNTTTAAAFTSTVEVFTTAQALNLGATIDLSTNAGGANDDAVNLSAIFTFVKE